MSNSQQNESFLMEVTHVFTREEAEASLEHILDHFRNDNHNFVTEEMAKIIELKHTKVLSKGYKSYLRMWANSVGDSRVLGLLEISTDDLDTYSWTEMVERPILELLSIKSEHTACKDAKSSLVEKDDYQLVENKFKLLQLHAMIEDQKKRVSDSQLHMQIRLAELNEELSVVKRDLESVKQQNAEIIQLLKRDPVQEESEDPVFTRLRKDRESQPYHFRK
ncbi:hypothetical protein N5P37_003778 [Trichoderma harzianum]|uniref:Uncharacterized protein n=1 Tax=Trichoderma harzianum CBS 226.95 TaxID=983964 RepID=A0A2T4AVJ0_TRIHA|nr:hypothetical protein M431DRAFT_477474 [Trichoderma harzianum CBS 226.95]KAK0764379.1 hypothetical protein N5P37_003778 [Trichoderma harzianum]PTB61082.1 hypothetical protein M431DRAFT_477474 [Trichoderma harzianum CBS 226.95]